jgi:hypothetical protein
MWRRAVIGILVLALPLLAGIRSNQTRPDRLEIDGVDYGTNWTISSPTLCSKSGYLSYDVTGKSPKVTFQKTQGPHSTWTFVEKRLYQEEFLDQGSKRGTDREVTGYSLKLRAAEGPYAGWYLAREGRELVLVKNPAWAARLVLVQREADIVHK